MKPRSPLKQLSTHEVTNMPPHLGDQDLWADDRALREWLAHCGGDNHVSHMAKAGKVAGLDETFDKANQANRCVPELRASIVMACGLTRSSSIRPITI